MSISYKELNQGHTGVLTDPCTVYTANQAIRLCRIEKGTNLLDYGCSVGRAANIFKKHECKVFGVDVVRENLQKAIPFCEKTFLREDQSEPLPFKKESIDVVFSSQVIEHLHRRDGELFMKEAYDLLRGGGGYF